MNAIDLDFDDDLARDAQALQFHKQTDIAQAGKVVAPHIKPPPVLSVLPEELHNALLIARECYGETHSNSSELFCHFVNDVSVGGSNETEAKELRNLLNFDKSNFTGRWCQAISREQYERAEKCQARRMAVWGAQNIIHAVINYWKGRDHRIWIQKALYRFTLTENDDKRMG